MWFIDPIKGRPSVTLTFFTVGFLVALFKLVFSGVQFGGVVLSPFTGVDFAAAVGALGAIYAMRRSGRDLDLK